MSINSTGAVHGLTFTGTGATNDSARANNNNANNWLRNKPKKDNNDNKIEPKSKEPDLYICQTDIQELRITVINIEN